jgi:hypothetical protein
MLVTVVPLVPYENTLNADAPLAPTCPAPCVKLFPEMSLDCFVAHVVEVKRDFYENMLIAYAPLASNERMLNKAQILELQCFVEDVIKIHRKLCIEPEDVQLASRLTLETDLTGLSVQFIEQLLDACEKVVNPTLSQDENPVTDEISSSLIQKIVSSCKYVLEMYEWSGYIDPEPETTRSICFLHHICQEVINST